MLRKRFPQHHNYNVAVSETTTSFCAEIISVGGDTIVGTATVSTSFNKKLGHNEGKSFPPRRLYSFLYEDARCPRMLINLIKKIKKIN
jgi:hypothetical protein